MTISYGVTTRVALNGSIPVGVDFLRSPCSRLVLNMSMGRLSGGVVTREGERYGVQVDCTVVSLPLHSRSFLVGFEFHPCLTFFCFFLDMV